MRHGGGALLPFGEEFLRLQNFRPLKMADFRREPLDRAGRHAQRGEVRRVAVARDHLRGHRFRLEPQFRRNVGLHPRIDIGEGADGT